MILIFNKRNDGTIARHINFTGKAGKRAECNTNTGRVDSNLPYKKIRQTSLLALFVFAQDQP
jgi:hypothetical protein